MGENAGVFDGAWPGFAFVGWFGMIEADIGQPGENEVAVQIVAAIWEIACGVLLPVLALTAAYWVVWKMGFIEEVDDADC